MERKIQIPEFRGDDDETIENAEPAMPTLSSNEAPENWENISEDWVSLFLDPAVLDEHSRPLSSDIESYSQFECTLQESNDQFSPQDLLADSLLLHSTDDQLCATDLVLGSLTNVVDDFGGEDSSAKVLGQVDFTHPKREPIGNNDSIVLNFLSAPCRVFDAAPQSHVTQVACASTSIEVYSSTSPASNLTQISGDSSSGMDIDLWKGKKTNPDFSITFKQELTGEVSSHSESPTSPSSAIGGESGFTNNVPSPSNVQFEERGARSRDVGQDIVSSSGSIARVGIPSSASQSDTFGVRHLQNIGNAIKLGLLGRSGDRRTSVEDREESNKPLSRENCEAESFKLQNQEVPEDQKSDQSDADRKGEAGDEDDEKRRARLMRNRESAQLSRQRKKVYVDELEGKLRTMTTTVVELNATISHLTTENVNLRRQLGYYYPAPGVCPRPGMPVQVLPMGPYPGMVGGRPIYPGGPRPLVPIPRIKTQTPARSSKRAKSGSMKEGGDKKRTKLKAAGAGSMAVLGLLCMAMLFSSVNQGLNDSGGVEDYTRVGNVRVGGRGLTSWNEAVNPLNYTGVSSWDSAPGWVPLQDGEYGPEREGVPSIHTRLAAEKLQYKTEKSQANVGIPRAGFESSAQQSIDGNETLGSHSPQKYFSSVKVPLLMGSEMVPSNISQLFAASVFVPSANGLVKVDGNLIIQAVMAGDKAAATKKHSEKNSKSRGKKNKKKDQSSKAMTTLPAKALDNLALREGKVVENATTGPFVTAKLLPGNVNSVLGSGNPVSPMLRAGSLEQWLLGGLHVSETKFVASELSKIMSQSPTQPPVDNSKAVAASQGNFYSYTPYDAAPRGPLHSWLFSGLSTEPIMCLRNISDIEETMPLLTSNEEVFENSMPFWITLPSMAYNQLLQKKSHDKGTCSVPTLSKLYWAAAASNEPANAAESRQCFVADRPVLNTGMCTEVFQFDTIKTTSPRQGSTSKAKNMTEPVAATAAQGSPHNITSPLSVPVAPRSRRDPFAVPLPPVKPSPSSAEKKQSRNGTDPRVENIIRDQMHNHNLRDGVSSIVVSVLAGPEEYGDSRRKETNGLSRIFVVVLVDNQKYVTYSCMLPSGGPQGHVIAE